MLAPKLSVSITAKTLNAHLPSVDAPFADRSPFKRILSSPCLLQIKLTVLWLQCLSWMLPDFEVSGYQETVSIIL
jgi:hypothetical protein